MPYDNQIRAKGSGFVRYSERSGAWHPVPFPADVSDSDNFIVVYRNGCPHSAAAVNLARRLRSKPVLIKIEGGPDRQERLQGALDKYPATPKAHSSFPAVLVQKADGHVLYIGGNDEFQKAFA